MALEASFQAWWQASQRLAATLRELSRCFNDRQPIDEAAPRPRRSRAEAADPAGSRAGRTPGTPAPGRREPPPIERLEQVLLEATRLAEEVVRASAEGSHAAGEAGDVDRARRALIKGQAGLRDLSVQLRREVLSAEQQAALQDVARKLRGEWPSWLTILRRWVDDLLEEIHAAEGAVLGCWQELAERVAAPSLSVRTTNVGQLYGNAEGSPVISVGQPTGRTA